MSKKDNKMLMRAALTRGDVDEVRRLVRSHKDVLEPDSSYAEKLPLHVASERGHLRVVQYLVEEAHCNVDAVDGYGSTSLNQACACNELSIVQYLVETGADVEARGTDRSTCLHTASLMGFMDIVTYLVEQGANVDAENIDGEKPLDMASKMYYSFRTCDTVRFLLPRTSSIAKASLTKLWKEDTIIGMRRMVLEKSAVGCGLANAFRRHPIQTILLEFPLPSAKAIRDAIELFPSSSLSLVDQEGRLPIHVALAQGSDAISDDLNPSIILIGFLFEREAGSALARDPTTGFYPHESVAVLAPNYGSQKDACSWLDVIYMMLRLNPQLLLLRSPRRRAALLQLRGTSECLEEPTSKRRKAY